MAARWPLRMVGARTLCCGAWFIWGWWPAVWPLSLTVGACGPAPWWRAWGPTMSRRDWALLHGTVVDITAWTAWVTHRAAGPTSSRASWNGHLIQFSKCETMVYKFVYYVYEKKKGNKGNLQEINFIVHVLYTLCVFTVTKFYKNYMYQYSHKKTH